MKQCVFVILLLPLIGCTYSICNTMNHSEGQVTDVVDTEQDAQAEVNPNVNIPFPGYP